jgi:hypothetical protein
MAWGLRRPVEYHDWRLSASEDELREYDAFGPWIYNVKAERDTPKRFRAACERHHGARFLLKVPRGVERRDAHPGMDLYVAMLAVHDHGTSFMRLTGEDVTVQDLVWDEVAALQSHTNLLFGRWTLMLRDGDAFSLDYNAVSSARAWSATAKRRTTSNRIRSSLSPTPISATNSAPSGPADRSPSCRSTSSRATASAAMRPITTGFRPA